MSVWFPREDDEHDPQWWHALERVAARVARSPELPPVLPCEFMMMARIDRTRGASIWLYKHVLSRRYLNIGEDGHTYRYVAPLDIGSGDPGRYVRHRSLQLAVLHLELDIFLPTRDLDNYCEFCQQLLNRRGAGPHLTQARSSHSSC